MGGGVLKILNLEFPSIFMAPIDDTPRFKPATLQKVIKHVMVFHLTLFFFLWNSIKPQILWLQKNILPILLVIHKIISFMNTFFHWNYYNSANKRSIRAILIMLLSSCIISYTLLPLDHGIFSREVEWLMVAGNKC